VLAAEDRPAVPPGDPPPLGTASFTPPPKNVEQPLTAANFVTNAGVTNLAEVELASMAQTKSSNPQIKAFAAQLIADHRTAQTQLKAPAAEAKLAMPGEMDVDHQKVRDELATLDGAAFDKRFIQVMTSSHDEAVKLFEAASRSPTLTPGLQAYAKSMLPKLQSHAQMAHKLASAR
jgi:putative membrane protein